MSSLATRLTAALGASIAVALVATDALCVSLSDDPLFVTVPVKPNVLLALDDSGSMDSEVLMPTNDGALWWHTVNRSFAGLDRQDGLSPGTINYNNQGGANATWKKYVYLFPIGTGNGKRVYGDSTHDHYAVPPVPEYAFARSPEYNKAYYDPQKTYLPWPSSIYGIDFADANPTDAPTDPVRGSATLNLTRNITSYNSNWKFKLQPGMRDPAGNRVTGASDAGFEYFPATYYLSTDASIFYDGGRNCANPSPSDYTAFEADPSILPPGIDAVGPDGKCLVEYRLSTGTAEMQNFANWFTYHRKRHLAMRGGILSAFADAAGIRTGLFRFNAPSSVSMLDLDTERADFFDELKNMVGSGGTPTRESLHHAGQQLKRTDGDAPITIYCQKNFTIAFTDGFAVPTAISGIANEDGSAGVPYADSYSSTLGDIAMAYYQGNLRPDLTASGVHVSNACRQASPNPLLDCNKNLHMVTYGVGLGVEGNLFGVTHLTREDAHALPPVWPQPDIMRNPVQVDDLYHATVNGRGEFLNAASPDEIGDKMSQVLSSILDEISSASSVAANSTSLNTGSQVFQARFHSGVWRGQLLAFDIDANGQIAPSYNWDAGAALDTQSPSSREIITLSRDTADGIPFTWADIASQTDTTQADLLDQDAHGVTDALGSARVDFLRGSDVPGFRDRVGTLGDIIHSSPVFVGAPEAGYLDAGYQTFTAAHRGRDAVIYAGANGGMLHGFDADSRSAAPGREVLAYVPGAIYGNLSRLTDPDYGQTLVPHRYFVDGSPMVADVELGSGWKTVLAAGLNRGGQGYYAIDITDPTLFSEANAGGLVLWEFSDRDDPDLGYTYNQPSVNFDTRQSAQIGKMNNGEWALIVPNGYNNTEADGYASTTGHASLFVLFIGDGADGTWSATDYLKIDTGSGSLAEPNGLSTPAPVDIDGDGDVDAVYAGDLRGNLWKFDLSQANTGAWTVGKLYAAVDASGNPQPITTIPMALPHPNGGFVVGFGTGRYLGHTDLSTTDTQTLYGIWDSSIDAAVSEVTGGRTHLQRQEVLAVITAYGSDFRISSANPVDYSTQSGWYMDLPVSGERVGFNPVGRDRRFVFVTLIPDTNPCSAGGTGWIMELDYLTGARMTDSPFDIDGDYAISYADRLAYDTGSVIEQVTVSGVDPGIGIPTTPTVIGRDRITEVKVFSGSSGAMATLVEGKSVRSGRLSWKQLIGE